MKKHLLNPNIAYILKSRKDHAQEAPDAAQIDESSRMFSRRPFALTLTLLISCLFFSNLAFARHITSISTGPQSVTPTYGTATTPPGAQYTITLGENNTGGTAQDKITITWTVGTPVSITNTIGAGLNFTPTGNLQTVTFNVSTTAATPAGNYTFTLTVTDANNGNATTTSATVQFNVNQKALTINPGSLTPINKVYDGTTAATFSGTPVLVGVVGADNVLVTGTGVATFATAAAALNKTVSVNGYTLGGLNASNYSLTQPTVLTATAKITQAPLTVSGLAANNKPYDGTMTATFTGGTLNGVVASDVGNVTLVPGGTFANVNAGNWVVTSTSTLSGSAAVNYTLTQPSVPNANITKAALTITAKDVNKTYATGLSTTPFTLSTTAAVNGAITVAGLATAESVSSITIAYGSGAAATDPVSGSPYNSVSPSGASGSFSPGNYTINYVNGNIIVNPAVLTVTGLTANNKTYDNTTTATFSGGTLVGVLATDVGNVTLVSSGTFASADVANNIPVTSTSTLSGTAASNYTLSQPTGLKANITQATLTITATTSKVYGTDMTGIFGSGATQLDPTYFTTTGVAAGEAVTAVWFNNSNSGGGEANTANVGTTYTMTPVPGYTFLGFFISTPPTGTGGFNANNYNIIYNPATVTVVPAPLTITASLKTRQVNTAALTSPASVTSGYTTSGLQNGETISSVTMTYGDGTSGSTNGNLSTSLTGDYLNQVTPSGPITGTPTLHGSPQVGFNPSNYTITYVSGELAVLGTYNWTGASAANSFWSTPANWTYLGAVATTYPGQNGGTDIVSIGVSGFTRQPNVTATPPNPVSTITFGNVAPVILTFNNSSAINLTALSDVTFNTGSNVTIGTAGSPAGTFNIGGNFANSGTVNFSGTVLVNFTGNGALTTGNPVTFTNVAFSSSNSSNTISSGAFAVSSTGLLALNNNSTLNAKGNLTLNSDINGSAAVGIITGNSKITGNVSVQRYLGAQRGYRLASSPVNSGSQVSYSVNYVKNSLYVLATTGTTAGFDGPSSADNLDLFREDVPVCNTTFICGNWRGINNLNSGTGTSPTYTIDGDPSAGYAIPVGTGFQLFTRGDKTTAVIGTETVPTYVANAVTLTATGTLNQGQVAFKNWYNGSANLGDSNSDPAVGGFNLVGNPYASTIDMSKAVGNAIQTTGVYAPNVNYIYVYNPYYKSYDFCLLSNPTMHQHTATQYIASGQGFFVLATAAGTPLIFNESAKVPSNQIPSGANTYMSSASALATATNAESAQTFQYLKLKIALDTINTYEMFVSFKDNAKTAFDRREDAPVMPSSSKAILFSLSSDNVSLALNQLPALNKQTKIIPLNLVAGAAGKFTISLDTIENIPMLYDVFLIDHYNKDTTSLRKNPSYSFNVVTSDTASFSKHRFNLMIRQNPDYAYNLLDFNASKTSSGHQTNVDWTTKNEENYTNFTVQRSIDNGQPYQIIGIVKANGSGTYSFTDKSPLIGTNLYRLEQENINDSISYSKVVPLIFSDNGINDKVLIYPNPARSIVNLDILAAAPAGTAYQILITNSSGLVIKQVTSSRPTWSTNISELLPGTYLVRVLNQKDNTLVGQTKFVKL